MTAIERLRFFDGEYLQSSDWTTEQAYHVAMRRRLNAMLHLSGIVDGLRLGPDADSVPGAKFFSISAGMAIDQQGREIVVAAPYVLRAEIDLARQGLTSGHADVWLCYLETAGTPPAAGYRLCNEQNQNTRWREEFEVVVVMQGTVFAPGESDPNKTRGGVCIGSITLSSPGGTLSVIDAKNEHRTYVGIRAQKVIAPSGDPDSFAVLSANFPTESLEVVPTIFADKHLIVGADFDVNPATVIDTAVPFDANTVNALTGGVAKIENALFLNGELYARDGAAWYALKDYIARQIPDIQVGAKTFTPGVSTINNVASGSEIFNVTSTLKKVGSAKMIVGLAALTTTGVDTILTWAGAGLNGTTNCTLQVNSRAPSRLSDNQFELGIDWTIGPENVPASPTQPFHPVTSLTVNYVVIFYP